MQTLFIFSQAADSGYRFRRTERRMVPGRRNTGDSIAVQSPSKHLYLPLAGNRNRGWWLERQVVLLASPKQCILILVHGESSRIPGVEIYVSAGKENASTFLVCVDPVLEEYRLIKGSMNAPWDLQWGKKVQDIPFRGRMQNYY